MKDQSVQFTAPFSGPVASWSVEGVVGGSPEMGLISSDGLFTAGTATGLRVIRAVSGSADEAVATASIATVPRFGVFTSHNDVARTGQNLHELALNPSTVNPALFGKLFSCPVDGWLYTQPLFVSHLTMPGVGLRNVVYVATEHDSVYAFDADAAGPPLWQVSLLGAGETTLSPHDVGDVPDIVPELGITGTPAIDSATSTLYVVAASKKPDGTIVQRLHALNLLTGAERAKSPVDIQGSVSGTAPDAIDGVVAFSPVRHLQRPGLLLSNGVVWVAFGSHGDVAPYHGWVFGYSASTLKQVAVLNTTPDASEASVWQSGGGIAADASGSLFLETANGDFDANTGGRDYGSSVLKLNRTGAVVDWFAPWNQAYLSTNDLDVGSGGPMLLPDLPGPHPHQMVACGKEGVMYVLDRDNLGHFNPTDDSQIIAKIAVTEGPVHGIATTPAYWNGNLYVVSSGDHLRSYRITGGAINATPTPAQGVLQGGTPSVSANGTTGGLVWVAETASQSLPAVLHAYDASDVTNELYTSPTTGPDAAGLASKFMVPTIANGKVYVPTQTEISVYGLSP